MHSTAWSRRVARGTLAGQAGAKQARRIFGTSKSHSGSAMRMWIGGMASKDDPLTASTVLGAGSWGLAITSTMRIV